MLERADAGVAVPSLDKNVLACSSHKCRTLGPFGSVSSVIWNVAGFSQCWHFILNSLACWFAVNYFTGSIGILGRSGDAVRAMILVRLKANSIG